MIVDQRVIQQLKSNNVENRKKAVKILVQSKDEDMLKYLAWVYKNDNNAEVRDLAKRGAQYLQKQTQVQAFQEEDYAPRGTSSSSAFIGYDDEEEEDYIDDRLPRDDELYLDDDYDDEEEIPLPDHIQDVSEEEKQRAKSLVDSATNWHMRGNDDQAMKLIEQAFAANPQLIYDDYTIKLASSIGNIDEDTLRKGVQSAIKSKSAKPKRNEKIESNSSSSAGHQTMALLLVMGAIVMLVGYFALDWVSFESLPVLDDTGQTSTLGEQLDIMNEQLDEQIDSLGVGTELFQPIINALRNLNITFSGLEVTSLVYGWTNIYELMGLGNLIDAFELGDVSELDNLENTTEPLDYSLLIIPVVGVILIVLGIAKVISGSASLSLWSMSMLLAILSIIPIGWFYVSSTESILGDNTDLAGLGTVGDISATQLLSTGYWVSVAGVVIILLIALIALVMPHPND